MQTQDIERLREVAKNLKSAADILDSLEHFDDEGELGRDAESVRIIAESVDQFADGEQDGSK